MLEAGEADELEIVRDAFLDLVARDARHREAEGGVVEHGLPGQQAEVLEHHGDAVGRPALDRLAVHQNAAAAQIGEAGDAAQQRGLAAARRAHDAHDLVALDAERHLVEGDDGAVEEELAGAFGDNRGRICRLGRAMRFLISVGRLLLGGARRLPAWRPYQVASVGESPGKAAETQCDGQALPQAPAGSVCARVK